MPWKSFRFLVLLVSIVLAGTGAHAVTGSGSSATGALETVEPSLTGITVSTSSSVQATFSEAMRATGLTTPGNYVLSGPGTGTLGANPGSASGTGPVTLTWASGEMLGGASLSLTVTGVQDALGNPINTSLNTAAGTGVGVAPVFSGLTVTPPSAAVGETVSVAFSTSEALGSNPEVKVNGNLATHVAKAAYTYQYTVLPTDALGGVAVDITGFDVAGNLGTLSAPGVLQVVPLAPNVPMRAWPVALALLAVGVLALARRRKVSALLVLALLAAPVALAAVPTVTNVSFVQQPTATNTQVVITYDLVSPNGPSNVTVSLSKNGGGDGFSFPVTSVTGDVFGVTTGTGKQIAWDISTDYPNEDIPNARLRLTADDGITQYTLTYTAGAGGTITGTSPQTVNSGGSGTAVTAVPNSGYAFAGWSDSVLTATRTDTNVLANKNVTANFIALPEMISVAGGTFSMGRTSSGDDATYAASEELPVHTVTLSAYKIGKYEVTNQQYCDVLNYAIAPARNYLRTSANAVWSGTGDIYAGGNLQKILGFSLSDCNIQFSSGSFSPKMRVGTSAVNYSTGTHPAEDVTWFGAVSFANWLSEMEGLTAVYDSSTAGWPANFANNGYHLPTEAQWERAAAWDGTHRVYSITADTLTGKSRANYYDSTPNFVNPLGLTTYPDTSPVGWFNGVNVSPNGTVSTTNSVSPVGAYDMSGNVGEWCHDWYSSAYYSTSPGTDPPGAASSASRVIRGGSWADNPFGCRSAQRSASPPDGAASVFGFRLAK